MSEINHTKGKLKVGKTLGEQPTIEALNDNRFCVLIIKHRGPVAWEDARRMVACWNAFDGDEFTTERIESGEFDARSLVDQSFRASEAHVVTMGKLQEMTSRASSAESMLSEAIEILKDIRGRSSLMGGEPSLADWIDSLIGEQQ